MTTTTAPNNTLKLHTVVAAAIIDNVFELTNTDDVVEFILNEDIYKNDHYLAEYDLFINRNNQGDTTLTVGICGECKEYFVYLRKDITASYSKGKEYRGSFENNASLLLELKIAVDTLLNNV